MRFCYVSEAKNSLKTIKSSTILDYYFLQFSRQNRALFQKIFEAKKARNKPCQIVFSETLFEQSDIWPPPLAVLILKSTHRSAAYANFRSGNDWISRKKLQICIFEIYERFKIVLALNQKKNPFVYFFSRESVKSVAFRFFPYEKGLPATDKIVRCRSRTPSIVSITFLG